MRLEDVLLLKKVPTSMVEMMKIVMEEEGVRGIEELHIGEEVEEVKGTMMKILKDEDDDNHSQHSFGRRHHRRGNQS